MSGSLGMKLRYGRGRSVFYLFKASVCDLIMSRRGKDGARCVSFRDCIGTSAILCYIWVPLGYSLLASWWPGMARTSGLWWMHSSIFYKGTQPGRKDSSWPEQTLHAFADICLAWAVILSSLNKRKHTTAYTRDGFWFFGTTWATRFFSKRFSCVRRTIWMVEVA